MKEEVLDLSRLNFDQVQCKIMQEMHKCLAKNPLKGHINCYKKGERVMDTTMNP